MRDLVINVKLRVFNLQLCSMKLSVANTKIVTVEYKLRYCCFVLLRMLFYDLVNASLTSRRKSMLYYFIFNLWSINDDLTRINILSQGLASRWNVNFKCFLIIQAYSFLFTCLFNSIYLSYHSIKSADLYYVSFHFWVKITSFDYWRIPAFKENVKSLILDFYWSVFYLSDIFTMLYIHHSLYLLFERNGAILPRFSF